MGVIGGGGLPNGGSGGNGGCDFFTQMLSFIGLGSCSGGGLPDIGGSTGGDNGGLLQTIEGAIGNLF
jgi:hypothetical protein